MTQMEKLNPPLIHRPCLLDPAAHPADCDRESCGLYFLAMDLMEAISYQTRLPQAEVMRMIGNPSNPTLYEVWKQALREQIGAAKARQCKFGVPLPSQDTPLALPEADA